MNATYFVVDRTDLLVHRRTGALPRTNDLITLNKNKRLALNTKMPPDGSAHAPAFAIAAKDCQLSADYINIPLRQLIDQWDTQLTHTGFQAVQLVRWHTDHQFCSRCGHAVSFAAHEPVAICPACNYHQYPRLQPCVIVAIIKNRQILLARNKRHRYDMHSLIAGYVEVGETLEHAVKREVAEETNLQVDNIRYLGSQPWPFPSNIMIGFVCDYAGGQIKLLDGELETANFYDFDHLPNLPARTTIAYQIINHICSGSALDLQ